MAAELLLPTARASDTNNDPYSGAQWFFYETGSSTPLAVYADADLSTSLGATVTADSAGKFVPIYLDASRTYRGVCKNASGSVTLHDIDPLNPASLSLSDNAVYLLDYIPGDLHEDILAGVNTDDLSEYFQAALDTGRVVHLPDTGMGWISTTLNVPSGGGLVGNGFAFTIKALPDFGNNSLIRNATIDPASNAARDQGLIFTGFRIDGNKANNSTATEFSHGLQLQAVDGAYLDIWTKDTKGDGVLIMYARPDDGPQNNLDIGCANIHGFIRSDTAARQGVTLACAEACDLSIFAYQADLLGCDLEPDHADNFIRDITLRLFALECGQANTGTCGGLLVFGTNALGTLICDVRNIDATIHVRDCLGGSGGFGAGLIWTDVQGLVVRGTIDGQTGIAAQSFAGLGPSTATLDLDIISPSHRGISSASLGGYLNGSVRVTDPGDIGVYIKDGAGGTLQVRVDSAAQQGIYLDNTDDMVFPNAQVTDSAQSGVYLANTSAGNRFPGLRSTGAVSGYGFQELSGCNDNRATNARISGNSSGVATLAGAASVVEREVLVGKATYDPGSLATDADTAIQTVTVTGAALGDSAVATFSNNLAGARITAWVSAANTVSYYFTNEAGTNPLDLTSGTVTAFVTPRAVA